MIPLLFPLLASASSNNEVSNANESNWFGNLISVIAGGLLHYKDGLVTTFVKNYTTYSSMAVFAILSLAFVKMFHKPTNLKLLVKWIVLQFVVVFFPLATKLLRPFKLLETIKKQIQSNEFLSTFL